MSESAPKITSIGDGTKPKDQILSLLSQSQQLRSEAENTQKSVEADELANFLLSDLEREAKRMEQSDARREAEEKRVQAELLQQRAEELKRKYYPELYAEEKGLGSAKEAAPGVTLEEAEQIMGLQNVLGPKDVERAFGTRIERVPQIPFSKEELKRAKSLNQELVLQVDSTISKKKRLLGQAEEIREPLTLKKLLPYELQENEGDSFYERETPRPGWRLVTREVILETRSKDYLEQIDALITYLKTRVFDGEELPAIYQDAFQEFELKRDKIKNAAKNDWIEASFALEELKIVQLTHELPVETLYRLLLEKRACGEESLQRSYTRTWMPHNTKLVAIGQFRGESAEVLFHPSMQGFGSLGICLSRAQ